VSAGHVAGSFGSPTSGPAWTLGTAHVAGVESVVVWHATLSRAAAGVLVPRAWETGRGHDVERHARRWSISAEPLPKEQIAGIRSGALIDAALQVAVSAVFNRSRPRMVETTGGWRDQATPYSRTTLDPANRLCREASLIDPASSRSARRVAARDSSASRGWWSLM
jgi:hypothetical protein